MTDSHQRQLALLQWFESVKRPLPWRRPRTAYGTWIAEIMLQQTTVATVVPFWQRFMAEFPTVMDLATAPEARVLALWSGLGYYRRARNLHQAAKSLAAQGGDFPRTREGWAALPGIGPYASGAIASMVNGQKVAAIDANARRVLARWHWDDPRQFQQIKPRDLEKLGADLVPDQDPGTWNEAVMELGALLCGARQARCDVCPVLDQCRAGLAGRTADIPPPNRRRASVPVALGMVIIRRGDQILVVPASASPQLFFPGSGKPLRDDFSGIHQGLVSLPSTPWYGRADVGDDADPRPEKSFSPVIAHDGSGPDWQPVPLGRFSHAITHHRLEVRVYLLDLPVGRPGIGAGAEEVKGIDPDQGADYYGTKEILYKDLTLDQPGFARIHADSDPLSGLARKALGFLDDDNG